MKISIIIPAHNEEKRIGRALKKYIEFFEGEKKNKRIEDFEINIIINGTTDKTEEVVKKYSKKYKEVKYLNFKERGKGSAIKEGFRDALKRDADLIGFVDADMATSPSAFYDLIKNIKNYDGIIASRYIRGAHIRQKQPISRIIVSRMGNFVIRSFFMLPYKDTQCGAKLFRKKALEKILPRLSITQWAIDIDLLYQAKKLNMQIKEFPTVWDDKEGSKLDLKKISIQVFFAVIQLRILNSVLKRGWWVIKPFAKILYKFIKRI